MTEESNRPRNRYDVSGNVEAQYVEAAKVAFKRDYAPMIEIIRQALALAENRQ